MNSFKSSCEKFAFDVNFFVFFVNFLHDIYEIFS